MSARLMLRQPEAGPPRAERPSRAFLWAFYRALLKRYGRQNWWPAGSPFEMIVGAILTQNTAWKNVEKAVAALKKKHLLSLRALRRLRTPALAEVIRPCGFFNTKAGRIKEFIRQLDQRHGGRLGRLLAGAAPETRTELLAVKGIGPETADSILLYAAKRPVFVVDSYTRRIFGRVGRFSGKEPYEAIRGWFEEYLPKNHRVYNEFHALIVRHAKEHCRTAPRCERCPVNRFCEKRGVHAA